MSAGNANNPKRLSRGSIVRCIIGALIFGALMALRFEMDSAWTRASVSACAGMVIGLTLLSLRTSR